MLTEARVTLLKEASVGVSNLRSSRRRHWAETTIVVLVRCVMLLSVYRFFSPGFLEYRDQNA